MTPFAAALRESGPRDEVRSAVLADLEDIQQVEPQSRFRRDGLLVAAAALIAVTVWQLVRGSVEQRPAVTGRLEGVASPHGSPYEPEDVAVTRARATNEAAWKSMAADIVSKHKGEWVVVGDGKLLAVGKTLALVAATGAELPHRYVFEVGTEGDDEQFVSAWYGTRFCGLGIHEALGITELKSGPGGVSMSKDDKTVTTTLGSTFPRMVMQFEGPDPQRRAAPTPSVIGEVFLGTVGPTMMLTPQDHQRLGLARFEIPGTVTVGGFGPARRAHVRVRVPELGAEATIDALVPAVPYEKLVDFARGRHAWWQWAENLRPKAPALVPRDGSGHGEVPPAASETWILFGRDRVLVSGTSPSDVLAQTLSPEDIDYHRYLMRMPRDGPLHLHVKDFEAKISEVEIGGEKVWCERSRDGRVLVVTEVTARRLRLELAEEGREIVLHLAIPGRPETGESYLRGGYVWLEEPDLTTGKGPKARWVLAVYLPGGADVLVGPRSPPK